MGAGETARVRKALRFSLPHASQTHPWGAWRATIRRERWEIGPPPFPPASPSIPAGASLFGCAIVRVRCALNAHFHSVKLL